MNPRYAAVARRADYRCEYCRAPEAASNFTFEVEHVYPASRGGSRAKSNLALACRACNVRKGEAIDGIDSDTGETIPLFDPRADRWADHFSFDPDTSEIRPLTAVARVTIARLDINHPYQIAARHVWAKFGLYP